MARPSSPRRSPDRFIEEFSQMLIDRDRGSRARLDCTTEEKQKEHDNALAYAQLLHKNVRDTAFDVLKKYHELETNQRDEADRRFREQMEEALRAQKNEGRRQRLEEQERREKYEREQQELQAREAELAQEKQEREAKLQERLTKERETSAAAAEARQQVNPPKLPPVVSPSVSTPAPAPTPASSARPAPIAPPVQAPASKSASPLQTSVSQRDAVHKQYLELHHHLKEMRASMKKESKQRGSPIAAMDSEMRREITKLFGQLANATDSTKIQKENQARRVRMIQILQSARDGPGPKLDARRYILNPVTDIRSWSDSDAQVPGAYIYLLHFCVKAGVQQMRNASSVPLYNAAEPLGITLAFIFGHQNLRWRSESFIDILLAKLHRKCPILFGIYGTERTNRGRDRLGWTQDAAEKNGYIPEQTHYAEMTGMAMGWAALTLRDFKKSRSATNSCPPWQYWRTMAMLLNTPPEETTPTHFVVLKGMLENYGDKFTANYGQAATVAMRKAIVEFPQTHTNNTKGNMVQGLMLLREVFEKKWKIRL